MLGRRTGTARCSAPMMALKDLARKVGKEGGRVGGGMSCLVVGLGVTWLVAWLDLTWLGLAWLGWSGLNSIWVSLAGLDLV